MTSKTLSLFLILSLTICAGCGGSKFNPINPPTVQAAAAPTPSPTPAPSPAPAPPPSITPQPLICGPIDGGDNCHWVSVIKDAQGRQLGYCAGDVYMWPRSMSFSLEIGLNALIDDPNLSGCAIFVPRSATIINLRGNLALKSWNENNTSIATWLYAIKDGQKNVLHNGKMQTENFHSVAVPFEGTAGQPLVFANGGYAFDAFLFWFNNDLAGSTPATISVAGSGDII